MSASPPPVKRLGPYELSGALGAGGMGEVWLARDTRLQRQVALKLLPARLSNEPDLLAAFRNEALALAALNHPNIATIHGLEELPGGMLVLVLELVEGESLAQRLKRGALALDEAMQIGSQVALALEVAHERGIVHRDLKPANIMLGPRGLVKVLDFGLAKRTHGLANSAPTGTMLPVDSSASVTGPVAGTPGYMSPEQVLAGTQDARTDLFAFGCVLYECLSGQRAFAADDPFVAMAQVLNDTPDFTLLPERTPAPVRTLLGACLQKDADARPGEARTLRFALEEALGIRRAAALREGEAVRTPHNLPTASSSFVGREGTLAECTLALAETRFLTLTGMGGSGKTRVALRLAEQQLDTFVDGVWFVDVAPLTDPGRLLETLAAVVGIRDEAGRSLADSVRAHFATRRCLVVLDNSETHPGACTALAVDLLASSPQLKMLVTNREPLGAEGETIYTVPALGVPGSSVLTAAAAENSEAVRLFRDRARAALPGFELTDDNAGAVAEICRRLDGVPLALELAAARVRLLGVDQIRARLGDRFKLLTRSGTGAPSRQQTVLAVIQWSWDHLLEPEQDLMRRLAVFTGGWTLDRATAVCSDSGDEFEMLDLLTRLAERALVVVVRLSDGSARYRYLESVWRFALEKLEPHLEHAAMRERHLNAYVAFAEQAEQRMAGTGLAAAVRELDREEENVLAALAWCSQAHDGVSLGLRLAGAAYRFWSIEGRFTVGRRVLDDALARDAERRATPERAKALTRAAGFALLAGDYPAAEPLLEESLVLARTLGDRKAEARALAGLGVSTMYQSRLDDSVRYGEQSLALYEQLGEKRGVAISHHNLGSLEHMRGQPARATDHFTAALTLLTATGDVATETLCRAALAASWLRLGDYARAHGELERCLALLEGLGSVRETVYVLTVLADLLHLQDRHAEAARLLGTSEALRTNAGMTLLPGEQAEVDAILARLEKHMGWPELVSAKQAGAGLTADQSVLEMKALLDSVRLD
ncbi:MAG: protein kinase [Candidatus Eisenbacteria bacterium]